MTAIVSTVLTFLKMKYRFKKDICFSLSVIFKAHPEWLSGEDSKILKRSENEPVLCGNMELPISSGVNNINPYCSIICVK